MTHSPTDGPRITSLLCQRLQRLAREEDMLAADEAARIPYWKPPPASVVARLEAARVLREEVTRLEKTLARADS